MALFWYYAAVLLAKTVRALPLRVVAAAGRAGGAVAYFVDRRHRNVALLNVARCLDARPRQSRALVYEHFRRLGENYACAIKTSGMSLDELKGHFEVVGAEKIGTAPTPRRAAILAIGHFGNFEIYAHVRFGSLRRATTYRPLKQPRLDVLVRRLRQESGCEFFDRRRDNTSLRAALARGDTALGLLADQHAGRSGARIRFFGHECSVTTAPAVLAQRYRLPLYTAICFRTGAARWRVEIGDEIPTRSNGRRRAAADVMADVTAAFERAVRRDPANWFWVHDRWRFVKGEARKTAAT